MAAKIGRLGELKCSTTDSSYTNVGLLTSLSFSFANNTADTTNYDDLGNMTQIYSNRQLSLSFEAIYDASNAGQLILITEAFTNRGILYFEYYPEETAGEKKWKFQATLDSFDHSTAEADAQTLSCSLTSTGAITMSTQ